MLAHCPCDEQGILALPSVFIAAVQVHIVQERALAAGTQQMQRIMGHIRTIKEWIIAKWASIERLNVADSELDVSPVRAFFSIRAE